MRFLLTFALLCALPAVCLADDFADRLYKAGQKAEKAGDKLHALLLYSRAAAMDPANLEFAMKKHALEADASMSATTRLDVAPPVAESVDSPPVDTREARLPPRLRTREGLNSFDYSGDVKTIFEKVMGAYGLSVVFEADFQMPPPFRFRLENVPFAVALRTLETLSNSFLVPLNDRLALVVHDTVQKRAEMSPVMAIAIPIPERISVQDAQEMMTAVQQTLEIRKFSLDPVKRVVYFRDQATKIIAAKAMFNNLSRPRAQVEVDVEFLEVTKNSSLGYGLQLPTSSALINFSSFMGNVPQSVSGLSRFLTFGGGASTFGIGIAASAILATFTKSDSHTILKSQIVTADGQPATLHVGERYPLVTATYSGGSIGALGQSAATGLSAPPTVNFEDLGLVLKVTPSVHDGGEVTLEISTEFKVLGSRDANGNPSISSRKYEGKVRMTMDESAIVAGVIENSNGDTRTGIAGVASLPVIGRFLRSNTLDKRTDEVLLVLRPRLIEMPPWEMGTSTIWIGTETKPLTLF